MKKFISKFNNKSFLEIIVAIIARLSFNLIDLRFHTLLEKYRIKLSEKLASDLKYEVKYGLFKGLLLSKDQWWGKGDVGTKCIGLYEKEIQNIIGKISSQNELRTFIDIGAADGYFAIGVLVNNLFQESIAFEISERGRLNLKENAIHNKVDHKLHIYDEADIQTIKSVIDKNKIDLSKTLILCDIEGAEYDLIDSEFLNLVKESYIIAELHFFNDMLSEKRAFFLNKIQGKYDYQIINSQEKGFFEINELRFLSDDDRSLILSEGRSHIGEWIIIYPK